MDTLINALREILGSPDFYVEGSGSYSSNYWDYGAMIEYLVGAMIIMIVISYIFRSIKWLFTR